jgi:hypothetical protein
MLLTRQWKHMKLLKWNGRVIKPGGAAATSPGELAVDCRSCPLEGINIPKDWYLLPEVLQYVFPSTFETARLWCCLLAGYFDFTSPRTLTFD